MKDDEIVVRTDDSTVVRTHDNPCLIIFRANISRGLIFLPDPPALQGGPGRLVLVKVLHRRLAGTYREDRPEHGGGSTPERRASFEPL